MSDSATKPFTPAPDSLAAGQAWQLCATHLYQAPERLPLPVTPPQAPPIMDCGRSAGIPRGQTRGSRGGSRSVSDVT